MNKKLLFMVGLFLLFSFIFLFINQDVNAVQFSNNKTLMIQTRNSSGAIVQNTAFILSFNISSQNNCNAGNIIYSNVSQSLTSDVNGFIRYNLTSINIDSNQAQLFLCYNRYNSAGTTLLDSEFTEITPSFQSRIANNITYNTITKEHLQYQSVNSSAIINISCSQIVGTGSDTDFCVDTSSAGGSFSNAISNLTAIISTDSRIIVTADFNPANNKTINLTLNGNVPYNASVVHRDLLNNITDANLSCSNILGATSNLCTLIDTSTSFNPVNISYINNTEFATANKSGKSYFPTLNNTEDLGNSSNVFRQGWFNNIFVTNFVNKITYAMLTLTNSIVNADISTSAAIAYSKLNLANSIVAGDITANAINNSAIADNSINGSKVQNNAVNASQANIPVCNAGDFLTRSSGASYAVCSTPSGGSSVLQDINNGSVRLINTSSSGLIITVNGVGEINQNYTLEINYTNFSRTYVTYGNETLYNYTLGILTCGTGQGLTKQSGAGGGLTCFTPATASITSASANLTYGSHQNITDLRQSLNDINSTIPLNSTVVHRDSLNNITDSNLSCSFITGATSNLCTITSGSSFNPVNLAYLNNTQNFTAETNFTNRVNIIGNLNVTGNITGKNLTLTDLSTCTLKTNSKGEIYCGTDNTGSSQLDDVYNGTVKALITDGIINITSNDVTQNVTFTLRLTNESSSYAPVTWAYNGSNYSSKELHASFFTLWINQTKSIIDDFARYWRNSTLDILGLRVAFTGEVNFSKQILAQGNLNVTSNFTTQNLTITDLKTCTLKTDSNGVTYCGTDNTASSSFSNAISNLTAITSSDKAFNISTSTPDNNRTIDIRFNESNYDLTKNYTSLAFGGTGTSLTASAGAMCYSTAGALAFSAVGTSGNLLMSTGASAPVWATTTGLGSIVRTDQANITNAIFRGNSTYYNNLNINNTNTLTFWNLTAGNITDNGSAFIIQRGTKGIIFY